MAFHYRHSIVYVALSHLMQEGMTALHLAFSNGHVEVATALLEKGAAIDLTDLVSLSCVLTLHVVMQNGVSGLATLRDIKSQVVYKNTK